MSECSSKGTCGKSSCEGCSQNTAKGPQSMQVKENAHSRVKKVIGVVGGKGGVGKSMVTSLLAVAMNRKGYKTAIMDADITGPSIPKMFGIHEKASATELGIIPGASDGGIQVMSLNLLTDNETDPVIWRGPVIGGAVSQFWTDVAWGDVDVMFIDMPPGTGDVPLTVYQSIPIDGVVMVTSPQNLVKMIVMKAVNMASKMSVPLLGIIENYSYFKCEDCGRIYEIFGKSKVKKLAKELNTTVIARIPIIPEVAQCEDKGIPVTQDIDMDLSNLL